MKRYQDLTISFPEFGFERFITDLTTDLPKQWFRNNEKESIIPSFAEKKSFCFERSRDDGLDASLWFAERDNRTLYVSNIVPTQKSQLSIDEYNSVLNEFINSALDNVAKKHKATIALSSDIYSLDDLVNSEAAKALRVFSSAANKSTGSAHPRDRARWLKFLSLAYKDRSTLSPEEVEKFLKEDGWSENFAMELAIEYEFANDLLEYVEGDDGI